MPAQRAQSGSAKLTMAQGRLSIETYHVSTLERPELPTKTAEPWWPLRFADGVFGIPNTFPKDQQNLQLYLSLEQFLSQN
jgi:hypothetical protein